MRWHRSRHHAAGFVVFQVELCAGGELVLGCYTNMITAAGHILMVAEVDISNTLLERPDIGIESWCSCCHQLRFKG